MMEEKKDIFFACGDAKMYLAKPMHKKYSLTFVYGHPSLYVPLHISDDLYVYYITRGFNCFSSCS